MSQPDRPTAVRPPPVLDSRTLGRPVHLLPAFCERLREDLVEVFVSGLNRRYRATFEVVEVGMERVLPPRRHAVAPAPGAGRWLAFTSPVGRIGFCLDRVVLLSVLHYRYGLHDGLGQAGRPQQAVADGTPETATETRLASMLGLQMVNTLAARIDTPPEAFDAPACEPHEFTPVLASPSMQWGWTVSARIREAAHEVEGQLRFTLDETWMARLLTQLAPPRSPGKELAPAGAAVAAKLPLHLVARLVEQELPLGDVLDLRVGHVIPVSLGAADVLVDDSRLFQASVAEHKGKLCLTSFADAE